MIFNWLPQMPFTDNHQLDLDWLISKYKQLEDDEATIQESLEGAEAAKEDAEAAATDAANSATAAAGSATAAAGSAEDAAETADSISDSLNQIAVNTARINNLVANAGDTDGNAELLDIRVSYTGYRYSTAGTAVRAQIDDVIKMITKYTRQTSASPVFCEFDTNAHTITFGQTCRFFSSTGYLAVPDNLVLTYTGATGLRYVCHTSDGFAVYNSVPDNADVLIAFYAQLYSNPGFTTLYSPYTVNGVLYNPYETANITTYTENTSEHVYMQDRQHIYVNGREKVIDFGVHLAGSASNGVVTIPYTANTTDHIYKVCVSHTENIRADSNAIPGYNTTLWAAYSDHTKDFKLVPVQNAADLTDNTFYYDGTNITIHITEPADEYVLADDTNAGTYGIRFQNCTGVIDNLTVRYARNGACLANNSDLTFNNCIFEYSALDSNMVCLNGSNITLNNCESFKARYDGFGNRSGDATTSSMVLNNCHGHYCGDDGVSHHGKSVFYINGGEYDHNGKAGIASPTYGSSGNSSLIYIHDNAQYGYYADNNGYDKGAVLVNSCLFKGNQKNWYIRNCDVISINNKYADTPPTNNQIVNGTLTEY